MIVLLKLSCAYFYVKAVMRILLTKVFTLELNALLTKLSLPSITYVIYLFIFLNQAALLSMQISYRVFLCLFSVC